MNLSEWMKKHQFSYDWEARGLRISAIVGSTKIIQIGGGPAPKIAIREVLTQIIEFAAQSIRSLDKDVSE